MATISQPVGMTSQARNLPNDVAIVQMLLNGIPLDLGGPGHPPLAGGIADARTTGAILRFQKTWFTDPSMINGRIDPNGATLALLNEYFAENVRVALVTATGATRIAS